ncbi:hypothetical protein GP954_35035, partial [Escherichia coli]|nr:hypothetical protein [Escherichia coli]
MTQARRARNNRAFAGFGQGGRAALVAWAALVAGAAAHAAAPSLAARRAAVQSTLAHAGSCQRLGDYYWEIGDAHGEL